MLLTMQLQSSLDWTAAQTQSLLQFLSKILSINLFALGEQQISLGSILGLVLQGVIVLLIARAVKQVLRERILTRFKLDTGTRESLSTIISYFVSILGFLLVLQNVGINISSLAVFAGALGIGFGIGLQNLASNFISGVTLLFEQPIKVGDFIEVGDLAGIVEQISIRSTTIRTIRGVAVIVPNSSFLENNIVNWTYRDPKCQISLPVNVLEDSDSLLITEALLAAAAQETKVLHSPAPEVRFNGYREDVLDFELLVWIDQPAEQASIKSSLYYLIESEFKVRDIAMTASQQVRVTLENLSDLAKLFQNFAVNENLNGNGTAKKEAEETKDTPETTPAQTESKSSQTFSLRELLQKVSYFQQCSDIQLRQIIEKGYRKTLPAQETICRENDPGDSFYIILSGAVEVFVESIGKQVAIRKPGEFIGEMSLLMGTPRTATLRTLEETMLFVVDRSNLQSLLQSQKDLADKIAEELSKRQETLKSLGITVGDSGKNESAFTQIRKRMRSLFGI